MVRCPNITSGAIGTGTTAEWSTSEVATGTRSMEIEILTATTTTTNKERIDD
jgi:hypothetical protein